MISSTSKDTSHKEVTLTTHPSIFPSLKHRRQLKLLVVPPAGFPETQIIVLMPTHESRMDSLGIGHILGSLSPNKNYKHRCGSHLPRESSPGVLSRTSPDISCQSCTHPMKPQRKDGKFLYIRKKSFCILYK